MDSGKRSLLEAISKLIFKPISSSSLQRKALNEVRAGGPEEASNHILRRTAQNLILRISVMLNRQKGILRWFLVLFSIFYAGCPSLFSKTIEVCPEKTCRIKTIRHAMSIAQNGDTIKVGGGFYYEGNLIIDKSICLISDENAVLDGEKKFEILTIKSPGVVVKGFCFQNTGRTSTEDIAAVHLLESNNSHVEDNCIENAFFGILVEASQNCYVHKNKLSGVPVDENITGNGIHLWKCENIQVTSNHIAGHRDGIYLEFVSSSRIAGNHSASNFRYGLHFMFSHSDLYEYNDFSNNGAGVAVMFSKNVNMFHNTFRDNWGNSSFGLLLKEISGGHINSNRFISNTCAAYFEGSANLSLHNNAFEKNGWALRIQASCENIKIDSNNFIANTFDIATNGTLMLNDFSQNYWDKYEGYDLKKDGIGDVPYQPVSLYSMLTEKNTSSLLLMRSFLITMLDRAERVIPSITPENLNDPQPLMKPVKL